MIEMDIGMVRVQMVRAVQCMVHVRRLAKQAKLDCTELKDLERGFREAAGELQRVEKLMVGDRNRPLLDMKKG